MSYYDEEVDYVTIKRMTVEEAVEQLHLTPFGPTVDALRILGIIREETLFEQFQRDNPDITYAAREGAKVAIEWMEARNGK